MANFTEHGDDFLVSFKKKFLYQLKNYKISRKTLQWR
jgi:hypothetical protein